MAGFTITIPGSNEDMNELRRRLKELDEDPERAGFIRDALAGLEWADAARKLPALGKVEGKVEDEE